MTEGWSHYVEEKKLEAGNIISFHRGAGESGKDRFYVDWRRGPAAPSAYEKSHGRTPTTVFDADDQTTELGAASNLKKPARKTKRAPTTIPSPHPSNCLAVIEEFAGFKAAVPATKVSKAARLDTMTRSSHSELTGSPDYLRKVVIKVPDKKSRREALKTAVGFSGVKYAGFREEDESQIEVGVADGVDDEELTTWLRKKLGYAELVSVAKHKPQFGSPPFVHYYFGGNKSVPDDNVVTVIDNKHRNEVQYMVPNVNKEVFNPTELSAFHLRKRDTQRERQIIGNDPRTCPGSQVHIPGSSLDCFSTEGDKDRWDPKLLETLYSSGYSILQLPGQFNEKLSEIILRAQPSRPLAICFCAEILVELNLSYRNDRQLWPGRQHFVNLEVVDLNNSDLTRLPDLSEANKLRTLNLQGCKILVDVSSVQHLSKLEHLNLKGCTSLRSLPSFFGLKYLSSLYLSDCWNLNRLPLSLGCLSRLAILDLRNCKRLHHIPISILRLQSLHSLNISGCLNLVKLMTGNVVASSFHRDKFVLGSSIHNSISSEDSPVELKSNLVNHDLLHVPDGGTSLTDQQQEYISAAMVSNSTLKTEEIGAVPQVEPPLLDQPVIQHSLKRSLNLHEEERSSNTVDALEESLLKRRTSSEIKSQNSQHSSVTEIESINRPPRLSILQVRKALEGYMNMSLEDIYQAAAFEDIESLVNTLIQQASNLHERAALEGLLCCVEEYKVSVPDTMLCVKTTQTHKTWLQVKLTRVGVSLVQAEEQCLSLQDRMTALSEEEEELEAEIQRLLAKKIELLDQQNSFASH